jgi:ribulose-phosphate 3-epimerase
MTRFARLKGCTPNVSIGLLTADLLRLGEELALLEEAAAEVIHVDVMDGVFCPQMTVGPPLVKAIKGPFLKEVHLMIDQPETKIHTYIDAGADIITFHLEATRHPHRVLQLMAGSDVVRGVALNPGTPLESVEPLMGFLDYVLLLAVNPGWSGQFFEGTTAARIGRLRQMLTDRDVLIGVDGGITRDNVAQVVATGADLIVTGSAVFDGKAPLENARFMIGQARAVSQPMSEPEMRGDVAPVRS